MSFASTYHHLLVKVLKRKGALEKIRLKAEEMKAGDVE
jgi:hypothetical protein